MRPDSSAPIAADSNPQQVPIADVLSRAGHELVQLAWHLEHLQRHIGPLIQEAAGRDANILHQMQSFDHIGQKAMGLADFLAALAQAAPRQWLVDPAAAAQAIMLADLSSRLGFTGEEKELMLHGLGRLRTILKARLVVRSLMVFNSSV